MSRWVTGSALDRAANCPGSTVLTRAQVAEGTAARHGKRVHKLLEDGKPIPGLTPEQQAEWYPAGGFHEVQAWYDPHTGTAGLDFTHRGRDYTWAKRHWVVGTLDYVHPAFPLSGRTVCLVDDLKTGLRPPMDTLQLAYGAEAVSQHFKASDVAASLTHVPRDKRLGPPSREYAEYDPITRAHTQETMRNLYAAHLLAKETLDAGHVPVLAKGPHCKWCGARKGCPLWL